MAHIENLIHSINVNGVLYEIHDATAIHDIADLNLSQVLKWGGVVATRTALPAAGADNEGWVYHVKDEDTEVVCVNVDGAYYWEDFGHAIVTDHVHDFVVTPKSTASASKLETAGSVVAGTAPTFTEGTFNAGSFEQGKDTFNPGSFTEATYELSYSSAGFQQGDDSFTANVPTKIDTSKFDGGSLSYTAPTVTFEQGKDSFSANVPTVIDTTKFNAGSASLAKGDFTAPTASFTAGEDEFTANTPTEIDVTKFNAGNLTQSDIVYTAPTLTDCELVQSVSNGVLSFSLTPGSLTGGSVTGGKVDYTAPSLGDGFYTAGSAASFTQGTDNFSFNAGSYTAPTLSYTAPSLGDGFYTAGSAASFTQGTDTHTFTEGSATLTPAQIQAGFYTAGSAAQFTQGRDNFTEGVANLSKTDGVYVAPTFTQGTDSYVAPSKAADTFNAGTHTQVTLPTFSTVDGLWNGANESGTTGLPEQAE
jgi:hypothetical protein